MTVPAERERALDPERADRAESPVVRFPARSPAAQNAADVTALLRLQRSAGNQAVARMLADRRLQRTVEGEGEAGGGGMEVDLNLNKRKRDDADQGGDQAPPAKKPAVEPLDTPAAVEPLDTPASVGHFIQGKKGYTSKYPFEYWKTADGVWHFTYFLNGQYHLKGNKASPAGFAKGFFNRKFEVQTRRHGKNANAKAQADGAREFAFCVDNIVPLYAALPGYQGQVYN